MKYGGIMRNIFLGAIILLCAAMAHAEDLSSEAITKIVEIKCDGTVDKFSINYKSLLDPKTSKMVKSSIDLGYRVQVWQSPEEQNPYMVESKVKSNYVGIDATLGASQSSYHIEIPSWGADWDSQVQSFTTTLTLKTGIVDGNVAVDCSASLIEAKKKKNTTY